MALNRIVRHTIPNKFDSAEFGTICLANYSDTPCELFIQLSHTDEAEWEPIGHLLESAFCDLLQDEEFIVELINMAATPNTKSYKNITTILAKK
ncbi:MAG: hypothetical protein ABSB40_12220 [Nitrososphaeria archaeon]|jgi:hypothetical protein